MAEINPFDLNNVDIWAEFAADEARLAEKYKVLQEAIHAHAMDTPFRPRQLWSFPTNEGWVRLLGYVEPYDKHGVVEHIIVNVEKGDSTDYDKRAIEVSDYVIDLAKQELSKRVTTVKLETNPQSMEQPCVESTSGPVIEYHNLNCEVKRGAIYNETDKRSAFDDGTLFEVGELTSLLARATDADSIMTFTAPVTLGQNPHQDG